MLRGSSLHKLYKFIVKECSWERKDQKWIEELCREIRLIFANPESDQFAELSFSAQKQNQRRRALE